MTFDDWQKVGLALTAPASVAFFTWITKRKALREKRIADAERDERRGTSEERITETRMLPEMMDRYMRRIESLEKEMREQTARMEREAHRMREYIAELHSDYQAARAIATKGGRQNNSLPPHDRIPSFAD